MSKTDQEQDRTAQKFRTTIECRPLGDGSWAAGEGPGGSEITGHGESPAAAVESLARKIREGGEEQ